MTERQFYRPDELATALGEPVGAIYRWIRLGRIRVVKPGRKIKIPKAEFDRLTRGDFVTRSK